MNIKGLAIFLVSAVGAFFLMELVMPGHFERFMTYAEGNWNALLSWFNGTTA